MRQPEKWKAGEIYTRELNGSLGEAHFPVEANPSGTYPVFGEGGRYVDAPVFKDQDVIEAIEVKTYHRWTTINGVAQMREVPLTLKLQEQINKDVALRNDNPGYQPRWVFIDAPPSAELQRALDDAGIIGNIFGHNKPAAAKPQPQPAPTEVAPARTLRLQDKNGEAILAAMLGTEPRTGVCAAFRRTARAGRCAGGRGQDAYTGIRPQYGRTLGATLDTWRFRRPCAGEPWASRGGQSACRRRGRPYKTLARQCRPVCVPGRYPLANRD
jgi:hypothetical protein